MSLCVKTFPPSVDFQPYVEVFLYHASHGACGGGKERNNIIQASQVALRKLEQIMKHGAWSETPTRDTSCCCRRSLSGVPCLRLGPRRTTAL